MNKLVKLIVALGLVFSSGLTGGLTSRAEASTKAADELQIQDMAGKHAMLMSDGSLWSLLGGERIIRTPGPFNEISSYGEFGGIGINRNGSLVEWDVGQAPHATAGQTAVKQISGGYWLKQDGSVWSKGGRVEQLEAVRLIGTGDKELAALTENGELLLSDPYKPDTFKQLATIPDAASVASLAAYDSRVALLYANGQVVLYQTYEFDDRGQLIPSTVAQDAVHIAFAAETTKHPTPALLVARKDGTVWATGNYKDRIKLTEQLTGLNQIVKISVLSDMDHFYAKRNDGSWLLYEKGQVKAIEVPRPEKLTVHVSETQVAVGDHVEISAKETYSNGAEIKVDIREATLSIDKPYLLRVGSGGMLESLGVGEAKVTVSTGELSESVTISASLTRNLNSAKLIGGTVYVSAKPVLQALGGQLDSAQGGGFKATLGETTLLLKAKEKNVILQGESKVLKAAPVFDKGALLIPASLLADHFGATVKWDSQWKQVHISFGSAKMTVVSPETAALVKKAKQGQLAKYIGKTYWVNDFSDWERFSKVTVSDVIPDESGSFVVAFKTSRGKTLKTYPMFSTNVTDLFNDGYSFLKYDPYKKYNWSSSIWNKIKLRQVDLGMTKEQVSLAWGEPAGKSTLKTNGRLLETWVYGNFDTVAFINGKVSVILY
ncbi:stalk domain-containing protein [Paenibacillus sanguinis]|uniref:stalk domain-containing protein n=1 Tax=Paenibacillus sanguinis TaxID=225906 RepID=UPI00036991D0|nr:stalk domain-containing protein [Paenibacillus sanguinis]